MDSVLKEVCNSFFKSEGVDLWMNVWACLLVTQPWKLSHCLPKGRGSGGFKGSRDAGYAFAIPSLSAPLPRHTFHTLASRSRRRLSVARQESNGLHGSGSLKPRVQTLTYFTWWLFSSFKANPLYAKSVGTVFLNDMPVDTRHFISKVYILYKTSVMTYVKARVTRKSVFYEILKKESNSVLGWQ